ncbi:hypothetical protein BC567DRAFT_207061 [Phyllosticta citribraziliensis]
MSSNQVPPNSVIRQIQTASGSSAEHPHRVNITTSLLHDDYQAKESLRTALRALETATLAVKDSSRKSIAALEEVPLNTSNDRTTQRALDQLLDTTADFGAFISMSEQVAEFANVVGHEVEKNKDAFSNAIATILAAQQSPCGPHMKVIIDGLVRNLRTLSQ